MSAGVIVNTLTYLPKFVRDFLAPPMPIVEVKNDPFKVQLERISHVYFQHPNLERFAQFARDFGFVEASRTDDTIFFRGYGKDQYIYVATKGRAEFKGVAFVATSQEEFDKAARLPGASLHPLDDAPGGGQLVTFARPNRTIFHVLFGQTERHIDTSHTPSETHDTHGPFNTPFEKPRLGQFQRYHEGPALVHKLGHMGYVCHMSEFEAELEFYTSNFNFVHSDILYHPSLSGVDVMTFMHLDRGQNYTDHHCFFLQRAPPSLSRTYIHHSSFEVADFDTQLIGHEWLGKKGWKSVWGVGRHILGSQIFDYWADPAGFKIEHYTDGDLVNEDTPVRRHALGQLSIWGPELPKDFGNDGTKLLHL